MGILDYISSRISLGTELERLRKLRRAGWPGHDQEIAVLEREIYGPTKPTLTLADTLAGPKFDNLTATQVPVLDNPSDIITVNGGAGGANPLTGPGTFLVQPKLATYTEIVEITMQPAAATTLQLVLGLGKIPLTAVYTLAAAQPWSWPGQLVNDIVYLVIGASTTVQVEARARPQRTV